MSELTLRPILNWFELQKVKFNRAWKCDIDGWKQPGIIVLFPVISLIYDNTYKGDEKKFTFLASWLVWRFNILVHYIKWKE